MPYNYEQSVWGRGVASLAWSSPTSFRLHQALEAVTSLPKGSRVLEIGCGAGQFIRGIQVHRPDLELLGCDISEEALRIARQDSGGMVSYELNQGSVLPYTDGSVDAVLIFDVLEHVEDVEKLLIEINRILKPGGIFYSFVPCEGDWLSWWQFLDRLKLKNDLTRKHAGHINYFSRQELYNLLTKQGFEKTKVRYSEHVLGQLVGIVSFMMMERAASVRAGKQTNNEDFFAEKHSSSWFRFISKFVNRLIYIESWLGKRIPSPNVHLTVRKK